jgi:putative AlgH/UPF0301 family transcriptional regulator
MRPSISSRLLLLTLLAEGAAGFAPLLPQTAERASSTSVGPSRRSHRSTSSSLANSPHGFDHEEFDDQDETIYHIEDQDWRAFQAKLVQDEPSMDFDSGRGGMLPDSHSHPAGELPVIFDDWRAFRANLVRGEPQMYQDDGLDQDDDDCDPASGDCDMDGIGEVFFDKLAIKAALRKMMTPLDPAQWAYESGAVVEQGTVVLGGVEQDFGFGLRQQYFHKAAILVVDHQETTFTKGIILNRPTDLELEDDLNPGVRWKLWFGGDVQGIESENPDIVCLHTLNSHQAARASVPIMNDIQWTTFDNAKRLVHAGVARPEDFQVFCGYAGWGPGQLMHELERKSWYMVATDSKTLVKELATTAYSDPRDAGLETWSLLMSMIGRQEMAESYQGGFDDLMLKEWSLKHLLSRENGGGARNVDRDASSSVADVVIDVRGEYLRKDPVDQMMDRASAAAQGQSVMPGHLVRASPVGRSPFLLNDQELHKSIILILSDDDKLTVGAILNRPAAKGVDIQVSRRDTGRAETIELPVRFGGQYSVNGEEPLLWVHCSERLRAAGVGAPVGTANTGIWKCKADEVTMAVSQGLASVEDFFVVTGVSVWTKDTATDLKGMQGEIESGRFEIIPAPLTEAVWGSLSRQQVLSEWNLKDNMAVADEAWSEGFANKNGALPSIDGRSGNLHQEDAVVFKSNVKVSKLADEALVHWVATFLLGVPMLN